MDGVTYLVYSDAEYIKAESICQEWEKTTLFGLEEAEYDLYVRLNVNNYYAKKVDDGKTKFDELFKYKGFMEPEINYQKSLRGPILSKAFYNYYVKGVSFADTVMSESDPAEFLFTKKSDRKFKVEYWQNGEFIGHEQNVFRYFLSKKPCKIYTSRLAANKKYIANQTDLFENAAASDTRVERKILSSEFNTEMINFLDTDRMIQNLDRNQYIKYINGFQSQMLRETQKYSLLF